MFVRASERRWFENSKKGSKLFLGQKMKELENFQISKIVTIYKEELLSTYRLF